MSDVQEAYELPRAVRVDEEVGAGEAEDDRRLVLGEEHRVRRDPPAGVREGDHDRVGLPACAQNAPDHVGALVAEEERPRGLERQDRRGKGASSSFAMRVASRPRSS